MLVNRWERYFCQKCLLQMNVVHRLFLGDYNLSRVL